MNTRYLKLAFQDIIMDTAVEESQERGGSPW